MTLYSTLHEKTKAALDEVVRENSKLQMPTTGRYLNVHATISPKSIPDADPEDLLVPGLYKVFVPEELPDGIAARCAFEAFNCAVPISCLETIAVSVIDPDTGEEMDIDFSLELDGIAVGNMCRGVEQLVAKSYTLSPSPYPISNMHWFG